MPFASISCASNQGFQYRAMEDFCKISAAKSFRYVGGLPVHVAYFDEAKRAARSLGRKLAEAALVEVKRLVDDGARIEIEATAVLP